MASKGDFTLDRKISIATLVSVVMGGLGVAYTMVDRVARVEEKVSNIGEVMPIVAAEAKTAGLEANKAVWAVETLGEAIKRIESKIDWIRSKTERAGP